MGWMRWIGALALVSACGVGEPATSTTNEALTGSNGVWQNGLTTNGVWQNGVWQNGVWQNGVWQNGVWQNGVWQNGVWQNGVWQNGVWQNGVWQNGVWQNGVWQNGVWQNGVWQNGVWQNGAWQGNLAAKAILNENEYAGQVLQYIYSCAMPAGKTTTLARDGKPDIVLEGGIGLAPQWGEVGGTCDETCQRWITACVLARTNAYGAHVEISMRAPDDAPDEIKQALAVSDTERDTFPLREGGFYGNMFATTPVDPTPDYSGKDIVVQGAPKFYACAGPGSNIPQLTKRFASSQGDDGPITSTGMCLPAGNDSGVCAGSDTTAGSTTFGAMRDCSTRVGGGETYKEVITVYLKQPIATCGNAVCESPTETSDSCPSDCHPGTWDRSFLSNRGLSAISPVDQSIVVASWPETSPFVVDSTTSSSVDGNPIVVSRYAADGTYQGASSFTADLMGSGFNLAGVGVDPDGNTVVVGAIQTAPDAVRIVKLDPAGRVMSGWPIHLGGPGISSISEGYPKRDPLAIDASGNIFMTGWFMGTATFGSTTLTASSMSGFLLKVSPAGQVLWAVTHPGAPTKPWPAGDSVVIAFDNVVYRLSASTGEILWSKALGASVNAVAAQGTDLYVTGGFGGTVDFGGQVATAHGATDFFLAKYDASGANAWVRQSKSGSSLFFVAEQLIGFDPQGNVVTSGYFGSAVAGSSLIDFGTGRFRSYRSGNLYAVSYSPSGRLWWSKNIPMVLGGIPLNLSMDANRKITMSGLFAGSMTLDNGFLVTNVPENPNAYNSYVGSFYAPCASDGCDVIAPTVDNVPKDIVLNATSPAGADGWFMLPTAIDNKFAGTNVICDPPANSRFPIGTTLVTCVATDPVGNSTTAVFNLKVLDLTPPIITQQPTITNIGASTAGGAIVTYSAPAATDQISGVTVTCTPPSGSLFAFGDTTVTCTAKDASNNTTQAAFVVTVAPPADNTPPHITVPGTLSIEATSANGATVTFSATASDDISGNVPVTCTPASGSTFALGTTPVQCSAKDAAGNEATASFDVLVHDTIGPVVHPPAAVTVEAASASGAPAYYIVTATDAVSGAVTATCSAAPGSVFALGSTQVTCSATDAAGNIGTGAFFVNVVDTTAPVFGLLPDLTVEATGPAGASVLYAPFATDTVSAVTVSCTPPPGATFGVGTTPVYCTASDAAGNQAPGSFIVNVVDTTAPAFGPLPNISVTTPSTTGAPVTFSATATDLVTASVTPTCSAASGSTFSVGTTTVTCSVHDAAGNTATGSFTVTVTTIAAAPWFGFLQPINSDGSSIFKSGSTIPVKFNPGVSTLTATIRFQKLTNNVTGTDLEIVSSGAADSGTTFRYDATSGNYIFNLSTNGLTAGTYQIGANLGDGTWHTVNVSLKK